MVRRTTSIRNLYNFRVVFTIFFFFVLTINLYFILIKEMFIYSNHYLIISKLTQENFKDYSADHSFHLAFIFKDEFDLNFIFHEPVQNAYTGVDNNTYKSLDYSDYIDLTIYEFESSNFINFDNDVSNVDILDSENENDPVWFLAEQEENNIEYLNDIKIINDQLHRSFLTEPFKSIHWCIPFTYYDGITEEDLDMTGLNEEEIAKKEKIIQDKLERVFRVRELDLAFEEDINFFYFPTGSKFVYFLNDDTYNYIPDSDNYVDESHFINHMGNLSAVIDLDNHEFEYWHEPIFVFPLIREMHYHLEEKDFFNDLHTSPTTYEWFNVSEFDHSLHRYS